MLWIIILLAPICITYGKVILLSGIPLQGHLTPLYNLGHILSSNGHTIYLVTTQNGMQYMETSEQIHRVGITGCENDSVHGLNNMLQLHNNMNNYIQSISSIFQWTMNYYQCMYRGIDNVIKQLDNIDLMICDYSTYACIDAGETRNISVVINAPTVLNTFSSRVVTQYDSNSPYLSGINTRVGSVWNHMNDLPKRAFYPMLRFIVERYITSTHNQQYNTQRQQLQLTNTNLLSRLSNKLILLNTVHGVEYAIDLPPHIKLIGPLIQRTITQSQSLSLLSHIEQQWHNHTIELPIVIISLGTIYQYKQHLVDIIANATLSLQNTYRFVWKLDQQAQAQLSTHFIQQSNDNIMIIHRFNSQLALLALPNTIALITHCGINSVHESLYYSIPVICIPLFADQIDMCARVIDHQLGTCVLPNQLTSHQLHELIINTTIDSTIQHSVSTARLNIALSIQQPLLLIESIMYHGIDLLIPKHYKYNTIAYYNIDVYIIWCVMLLIMCSIIRLLYMLVMSRLTVQHDKNKIE